MKFSDITQEWVDDNKEMLHSYYFDVIMHYYYTTNSSFYAVYINRFIRFNRDVSYEIKIKKYNMITIRFGDQTDEYVIIDNINEYVTFDNLHSIINKAIHTIGNYLQYTRDMKINDLI